MQREKFLKALSIFMSVMLVSTPVSVCAEEKGIPVNGQLLERQGQVEAQILPERGSSASTIINNRERFKAYEGEGTLYLTPKDVEYAKIYVNGECIELDEVLQQNNGKTVQVDISEFVVNGENTLQISNIQPKGATIQVDIPYPTLQQGTDADCEPYQDVFKIIDQILAVEIAEKGIPGGQLLIAKDGKIIKNSQYGYAKIYDHQGEVKDKVAVTTDTLYDLASNTKMYATNLAIQQLVSQRLLTVDTKIDTILEGFSAYDEKKGALTVAHLLTHTSGFVPSPKYHNENYAPEILDQNKDGKNDVFTQNPEEMLEMIKKTPLQYEIGAKNVYSDVDYMLLGLIIEKISGKSLDAYCEEMLYKPLELSHTVFNPLDKGFEKENIAATEIFGNSREQRVVFQNVRTEVVQGEVHDEKAYHCFDGVAGHAGLFSTADDLAILMQTMLNGGGYGGVKLFDQATVDQFVAPCATDATYGLGWRRQKDGAYAWAFGEQAPDTTIGHTGWTGTCTMIDFENDLLVIWLTNTKNTPIANPDKTTSRMEGDAYQFDAAGTAATLMYEGIIGTSKAALHDSLLQMALDRTAYLKDEIEKDRYCTPADYRATGALVKVLFELGETQKGIIAYEDLPSSEIKDEIAKIYLSK